MPAPSWFTRTFVANKVLTATQLNEIVDNFAVLEQHTHAGTDGDGDDVLSGFARWSNVVLYPRFAMTLTNFSNAASTTLIGRSTGTSTLQNALIEWPVTLPAGTFRLDFIYLRGPNQGIATFKLDSTTLGTVDMYNAGSTNNVVGSVTGFVVTDGSYTLQLSMATKNASSAGYQCTTTGIMLRRTA